VRDLKKTLGHEGSWFGFPRIPDEYRNQEGGLESADEITERVAMEIIEGYNDLVRRGLATSSLSEIMHHGIEGVKKKFGNQIRVGRAIEN
jgi:hypothetical protein